MADNPVVDNGTLTDITFAGDDVGGVIHQRVKISVGADGSATDMVGGNDADGSVGAAGSIASVPLIYSGTNFYAPRGPTADGQGTNGLAAIAGMLYNGATFDRQRGNLEGTLLASAARTTTTTAATQTNYNHRGVIIWLNVTVASGTGGLQVRIFAFEPVTGTADSLNATPTAITATGIRSYLLYPGASGGGVVQATSGVLTRTWTVQVLHGDASSYTYSVGYSLVV